MKRKLFRFALPVGLGLLLVTITVLALVSTTLLGCFKDQCPKDECYGTDRECYSCTTPGEYCSTTPASNCGGSVAPGVYCCN